MLDTGKTGFSSDAPDWLRLKVFPPTWPTKATDTHNPEFK